MTLRTPLHRLLGRALALLLACAAQSAPAQSSYTSDPLRLQSTRPATAPQGQPSAAVVAPATQATPSAPTDAAALLGTDDEPGADLMFGHQLFRRGAEHRPAAYFNPDYALAVGDQVVLRMWGAFNYEAVQTIDPQGNVFLPNVGPVRLASVPNGELDDVVRAAVRKVYRSNVDVYAALDASQPVRVFVTGFVRAPGQYPGVAAESVLGYLQRAGGVDPNRGSYIEIRLLRNGEQRAVFNLYDFLLEGQLDAVQLRDGDTLVVEGRHNAVRVSGDVFNAYRFEFKGERVAATELLRLARPKPGATHVSIVHQVGTRQVGEYYAIDALEGVTLAAGDELSVVSDLSVETLLVRVDGAIESSRVLTLPYGARLRDALALVRPKPQAQVEAVQLFRASVAQRQREMLEVSLRVLETSALTARSSTSEESQLRAQEAALVERFVQRARTVQPRGQVVLSDRSGAMDTLLENGDVLVIPERSSIVMVHGEVTLPNAMAYDSRATVADYVEMAGGTTQRSAHARILLLRQDGTIVHDVKARPQPGDEIMVLPKVGTRNIEVARGITQILYQIAIATKVIVDL